MKRSMSTGSFVSVLKTTLMAVTVFLFIGCWFSRDTITVDPKASAAWFKHESVFQKALKGYQKDDEFEDACRFFEKTTGLELHLNFFTFGTLPTPESEQDLVRLRAWYKVNKQRLYWDEATQTVKVRPLER